MMIRGLPYEGNLILPVVLLGEGNQVIPFRDVRYRDLWRSDLVSEVDPSAPEQGHAAYYTVLLTSGGADPASDVDIDVLDYRSAELVGELCDSLHRAEKALMRATARSVDPDQRVMAIQTIEGCARAWLRCNRAVPVTVEVEGAPAQQQLARPRQGRCVDELESSSATVFWQVRGLLPQSPSSLMVNLVDREDAKMFEFLHEQLITVREFGLTLRPWVMGGAQGEPPLSRSFYEALNVDPRPWAIPAFDLKPEAWLVALRERGLDFDPASATIEDDLVDLRNEDGEALVGRRLASRIAWSVDHFCARHNLTREDLQLVARDTMPAAADAASMGMKQ
ncbi:hypothetical protein [Stenotrophomonas maltophilia]|uniref:hypothetical protein n=1 Tax=Stenotrophomonas maltophilia TaxID=40324 RepID=UPI0024486D86|nr:hypothetical protein [Stenotrophomonas maltophilia]MDH0740953.1 hypothetical protein [Stenotrophomonas maltophilia]MDH1328389.1 hypothetical protein [Stenotrophomonas maltophilia]